VKPLLEGMSLLKLPVAGPMLRRREDKLSQQERMDYGSFQFMSIRNVVEPRSINNRSRFSVVVIVVATSITVVVVVRVAVVIVNR
jgi:hypothetical protein